MSSPCEHVSKRVQKTKKEIEQLKDELQKLLKRGVEPKNELQHDIKSLPTFTEKEKVKEEPHQSTSARRNAFKNITVRSSFVTPQSNIKKQDSPKKVRSYNVEEAREYIRKQKEKRIKTKSDGKESQTVIDMRKEKLRELQKKSLHIVQKNVNFKRERSKSRDRGGKLDDKKENVTNKNDKLKCKELHCDNRDQKILIQDKIETQCDQSTCILKTNHNKQNDLIFDERNDLVQHSNENPLINNNSVPDLIVNNLQQDNIKINDDEINIQKNKLIREGAAIKIQRYYRKYRDKKLLHKLILKPAIKEPTITNVIETKAIPSWLTPKVESYPYNFINTVKRKLNFVTNKNKDIGIQINFNDTKDVQLKTSLEEIIKRNENDYHGSYVNFNDSKEISFKIKENIKKSLEESNKKEIKIDHFIDRKETAQEMFKRFSLEESKNKQNDLTPQIYFNEMLTSTKIKENVQIDDTESIETSSRIKKDLKKSLEQKENKNSKIFLSQNPLNLDLKKIGNLNLLNNQGCDKTNKKHSDIQQHSDSESDTSKNIPDISTESASKKSSTSNLKATSDSILQINIDKIKDLKLEKPIHPVEMNFIEKFCSKSSENISKRSQKKCHKTYQKSRSASSISNIKEDSKKNPSPLHIPNLNLIPSDPPTEYSNNDLKSFLEFMSNMEPGKHSKKSDSFVSLPQSSGSESVNTEFSLKSKSQKSIDKKDESYSSRFSGGDSKSGISPVSTLKRPTVSSPMSTSHKVNGKSEFTNIPNQVSIKPGEVKCIETKSNTNQIHLKFEAELHLLNDFNESLRQFMAVEKTILDLHSKNQNNSVILQNQDTQTSAQNEERNSFAIEESVVDEESISEPKTTARRPLPNVNYSRGSDIIEDFSQLIKDQQQETESSSRTKKDQSLVSVSMDYLLQLDDTINSSVDDSISNISTSTNESFSKNAFAGFSVGMFDQLIRDEDTRIDNLKTILKIREKALLDRTKGELAWLEIQKKQLIETGQVHEASLLKKKQRGIIIKLQHEKQEMQRLKQIQKQASKERKIVLKEQRNMIKAQLSNNYTIPKIKRSVHKERRQPGPVKVYNVHRETINTETSISRKNSVAEEIIITSRSESVVGQITEDYSGDQESLFNSSARSILSKGAEDAKKSLLMREAALQKRKKAAEELLQWHQRLLEEERKIAELEMAANTIIKQAPSMVPKQHDKKEENHKFKGSQLNLLWLNMTGRDEKKFNEAESYDLSPIALEKFCKEAKKAATKTEKHEKLEKHEKRSKHSSSSSLSISTEESIGTKYSKKSTTSEKTIYSEDFEPQVVEVSEKISPEKIEPKTEKLENEIDKSKSTLNEIMQNISNITDEISAIYKLSTSANVNEHSATNESVKTSDGFVRTQSNLPDDTDEIVTEETQKISEVNQNDLDQEINEILSVGTQRINDILNSRTQNYNKIVSGDESDSLKICENSIKTENNLMDISLNKSKSLDEPIKSKSISITVLKPNENSNSKSNSFNSSVTLVKNLTELIKTQTSQTVTENNIRNNTPETKNTLGNDSSSTFSPNGELLSGSNEPKVEINDKQNTSTPCQIGDIFSKGLAVEDYDDCNFKQTEKDNNGFTVLYKSELLDDSSSYNDISECEEFEINTNDDKSENYLLLNGKSNEKNEVKNEIFEEINKSKVENDITSNLDDKSVLTDTESKLKGKDKTSDLISSNISNKEARINKISTKSDDISSTINESKLISSNTSNNEIKTNKMLSKSDDISSTIKKSELISLNVGNKEAKMNKISLKSDDISSSIKNSGLISSNITNKGSKMSSKSGDSSVTKRSEIISLNIINKEPKVSNKLSKSDDITKKSDSVSSHIINNTVSKDNEHDVLFDLNNTKKDKSEISSNGDVEIVSIEKIGVESKNKSNQIKTKTEIYSNKSNKSDIEKIDKSSTLSNVSSINDDDINKNNSSVEESSKKIIFKPLKTLDDDESPKIITSENYSSHNGHDVIPDREIKWEEKINDLQNIFHSLDFQNKIENVYKKSQTEIRTSQHSDKNETLDTTNDIESIRTDKTINDSKSSQLINDPPKSFQESEELKKTEVVDDTSGTLSINELSQLEEFQTGEVNKLKGLNEVIDDKTKRFVTQELSPINNKVKENSEKSSSEIKTEINSSSNSNGQSKLKSSKSEIVDSKSVKLLSSDVGDFVAVKKRVSEILADAHSPRGDKSPRLQDIYTTTYDILSPDRSPEMGSPVSNEKDIASVTQMYGEEAEALFKKQLAIEQEIKQLEQQQKEQIPYMYMREIPNKPPPPYTPPVTQPHTLSAIPTSSEQLDIIVCNIARILHNSYFKGTLEVIQLTDRDKRTFSLRNANIDKQCYEYVFDLGKELAVEHYRQFVEKPKPSWMKVNKKFLAQRKPFNELELRQHLFKEIKVLIGFEKDVLKENLITKWCRKKRDHVDEILIVESQAEESEWTNYDEDEVVVKDELTNDIMKILLAETAQVWEKLMKKRLTQTPS
nr:centrosome-associated protein 350-like [Onthophagus taurus]